MPLIIDTDLGTDVDDVLALGVLLGSPESDLLAVTTVYGDVTLRARLAARLISLSGAEVRPSIHVGRGLPRRGRPVWWAGHEGRLHHHLQREVVSDESAVDALVRLATVSPREVDILAIGPLTNIAGALDRDPLFERNVRRLVVMGGDFRADGRVAEHNFVSDVAAAQRVFESMLPIVVGGLDLTTRIRVSPVDVERIVASGVFGAALGDEISQWWEVRGSQWNNPHDSILALWLLKPELFQSVQAGVRVDEDGRTWEVDGDRITIIRTIDADAVRESIIDRICRASALDPGERHIATAAGT